MCAGQSDGFIGAWRSWFQTLPCFGLKITGYTPFWSLPYYKSERPQRNKQKLLVLYIFITVLYFQSLVGVMRASSPSMSDVASVYSLNSSGRGTTFSSFIFHGLRTELRLCAENVQLCVCVNRLHARGAVIKDSKTCLLPHVKRPR